MRLTDIFVRNLRFEGKKIKHFDDSLPNFGVRVYKSGVSFIVMLGNDRRMRTIGKYPAVSLKQARIDALRILGDGISENTNIAVSEALKDYYAHCERKNKPRTVKDYKRLLNKHLPRRNLADLTKPVLLQKLNSLRETPAERSHATTAFQIFLNWCVNNGHIESNPIAGLKNQGVVRVRERFLSDSEISKIWGALGDERFSTIIRILMLTGIRRGEYQHMSIEDSIATIPKGHTKNGREHIFPVGDLTIKYYENFSFNGWGKSKKRLDDKSGVYDWTLHDLRRTFASNHARLGTPIHVVEKMLNHVSGSFAGVAGIYNRYSYMDEMKLACDRYEEWLSSLGLD